MIEGRAFAMRQWMALELPISHSGGFDASRPRPLCPQWRPCGTKRRFGPIANMLASRPQPQSRVLEFWQQPRRCHAFLLSPMRRSGLLRLVFRLLWPRFRCEEEFPDNRQRPEAGARMRGFVQLSFRSPRWKNLRPPTRYGSAPYRGNRAACVSGTAAGRSEKSLRELRHVIRKYIFLDAIPHAEQKMSSGLQDPLCFAVG